MDLLTLLEEGVVLCDTAKGELVHKVDLVRLAHPLVLFERKTTKSVGEGEGGGGSGNEP